MNINHLFEKLAADAPILQATFGLEREGLRINQDGKLAQTPHPQAFGSRNFHPTIQTDFSEQQLELITPTATSTKEAMRFLAAITDVAGTYHFQKRINLAALYASKIVTSRNSNRSFRK